MSVKRFIRGGNGREWWRGRINLVNLPSPVEDVISRTRWGTEKVGIEYHSDTATLSHLETSYRFVPEGLLVVDYCMRCGGRQEHTIDCQQILGDPHIFRHVQDLSEQFVAAHAGCEDEPLQHTIPEGLIRVRDTLERAAREDIAGGRTASSAICVVTTDLRCFAYTVDDVLPHGPDSTERLNEVTARSAAMRRYIERKDLDVLGVVFVAEAWLRERAPDEESWAENDLRRFNSRPESGRSEGLLLGVMTTAAGLTGFAPISRRSGTINRGPGQVGEFTWSELGNPPLLRGLLATPLSAGRRSP